MLYLNNLKEVKDKLTECNISSFVNINNSFKYFICELEIVKFRHLANLIIPFDRPITIITGTNKTGKTSILLLIACSHENFIKLDSASPEKGPKIHVWSDVLSFTKYESVTYDYIYRLKWRVGTEVRSGEGKRLAKSKSWSGLGKKSSKADRINAKIKDRHVRLIDLERILPVRNFSHSLFRKTSFAIQTRLNTEIEDAYSYIFDIPEIELYEIGTHVNKVCYLIKQNGDSFSSYNAASGEESMISILKDIIDAPQYSLILIDEIEAGFHPSIQRKLADVIQYISWRDKKQFIITSHSPTLLSAFPQKCRKFIERKSDDSFGVISRISKQAAFSKMDAISYPIVNLYCEDDLAEFLIKKVILVINESHQFFGRLINIIKSGAINQVKVDYKGHKKNFPQLRSKIGYCCVFDGDYKNNSEYSAYHQNESEFSYFLYPYMAPEKFLIGSFLRSHSNANLATALKFSDHHSLFQEMVNLGLAADEEDGRNKCFDSFKTTPEYRKLEKDLMEFLINTVKHFSTLAD